MTVISMIIEPPIPNHFAFISMFLMSVIDANIDPGCEEVVQASMISIFNNCRGRIIRE